MKKILIIKQDGTEEVFDADKLRKSLRHSGASDKDVEKVVGEIKTEIKDGMTTDFIYKHAFEHLERTEKPVAARYSMKRAVMELGPSGYPFEDFIAEIFRAKGYAAEVGVMINGACVEHEVDIIAKKDGLIIGAEVKFHNQLGIRSDLKVALYVRARFEDIRKGKNQIDEDWLITNTKFTGNAIKYGECVGMKMVAWNYPKDCNLHDLINETGIQPITALTTLSNADKMKLIEHKVTLCKNIEKNEEILNSLGINKEKIKNIMKESQVLCKV